MTFTLTSPTLTDNATLPLAHVHTDAGGQNHSPELRWANPPAGTKSFALSCYDPDAPTGSGFWHWYIINLPAQKLRRYLPCDRASEQSLTKEEWLANDALRIRSFAEETARRCANVALLELGEAPLTAETATAPPATPATTP